MLDCSEMIKDVIQALAGTANAQNQADYAETHSTLATLFHNAIQGEPREPFCYLGVTGVDVMTAFYRSKSAALRAARKVIDEAYDKANRFFTPGSEECLSDTAARHYAGLLTRRAAPLLKWLLEKTGDRFEMQLQVADQLVKRAEQTLRDRFEAELRDDADFYKMYERRYFHDQVYVDDLGDDAFDSSIANSIMNFLFNDEQYMVDSGLQEALTELQNDVNSHGKSFYANAHGIYREYCLPLEELAEEIGRQVADEELRQWGVLAEAEAV